MQPITRGILNNFEASARNSCKLCQLVLAAVTPSREPGRLEAYIRPGTSLNIPVKATDRNARYDLFTEIGNGQIRLQERAHFSEPYSTVGSARTGTLGLHSGWQ